MAAAGLVVTVLGLSACTGEGSKKPSLFGIPLPTFSSSESELSEREQRQLDLFDRTVRNPSPDIDPHTRKQAAEELIAMDLPAANDRLSQALQSGESAVRLSVIDALESWPEPVEGFLPDLWSRPA